MVGEDHIFGSPVARRPPPPKKRGQSEARRLLQCDLATGAIHLSGHLMNARQAYDSRPDYAMLPFDLFPPPPPAVCLHFGKTRKRRTIAKTLIARHMHMTDNFFRILHTVRMVLHAGKVLKMNDC